MGRRQEKDAQDAAGVGLHLLAAVVARERDRAFVFARKLNHTGRGARVESQAVPDNNLTLGHAGFFGASNSLAR